MLGYCGSCGAYVLPMEDGRCPSCKKPFVLDVVKMAQVTCPHCQKVVIPDDGEICPECRRVMDEESRRSYAAKTQLEGQQKVFDVARKEAAARRGPVNLIIGFFFFGAGTTVTLLTLGAASHGGPMFVCYGAVIGGFAQMIMGFFQCIEGMGRKKK